MNDGTDPETIPESVRLRALAAPEVAIDRSLRRGRLPPRLPGPGSSSSTSP
jgi:hypothetical protein